MSGQSELVCSRCQPLEVRVAELETELVAVKRTMNDENTRLADEVHEGHETRRMLEGKVRKLKADLTTAREESPQAERVRIVLDCWVQTLGHKRADVSMTGDRAKLVMSMLRRRHCGAENVEQQTFMLCRAIKAVGLKPYKLYQRSAEPLSGHKMQTQLEHCIGKDKLIEEHVDIYRRACKAAVEKQQAVMSWYERVSAIEKEWAWLAMAPLAWFEQGKNAEEIEQYLWERLMEKDRRWADLVDPTADPLPESDIGRVLREMDEPSNVVPIRSEAA